MNLIVFNNPAALPWQTNLCDVMLLAMFLAALVYAVVQFRRGRRLYVVVLIAAFIYGLVLELAGMATLNMYQQGEFAVMINWPAFPLWHGTTMMPSYVLIFYPVFLFTGFKVVEHLGIEKRWQAAITGGLFMIAMDAPYIIEGNLRHIVWWTWDPNFKFFQYWVGWPLVDLCWQGIWDAVFIYIMLWALPRVDGTVERIAPPWSNAKALGGFPPLAALTVLIAGPILLSPIMIPTALGGRQWPLVALLVAGYIAVAVAALRAARPLPLERFTVGLVAIYVACFAAMVIANVIYERALTQYAFVQSVGLVVMSALALYPLRASRGAKMASTPQKPAVVASAGSSR
jgi:hypothetical protein